MTEGQPMTRDVANRFDDFFEDPAYLALKNSLYNYRVRRRAIRESLSGQSDGMTLEIGSGISPICRATDRTVFTELSFSALRVLRDAQGTGHYVVADATRLPFKPGVFRRAVCSEVLEHIEDDRAAVREMTSSLEPGGRLAVTFPHRQDFYAVDDRFVGHHRRYDLADMATMLRESGFRPLAVAKVLGPLEKLTMGATAALLARLSSAAFRGVSPRSRTSPPEALVKVFCLLNRLYAGLARVDARVWPARLASVLLIVAEKRKAQGN